MNDNYPIPGAIEKRCGCIFTLIDEQPVWYRPCTTHQTAVDIQTRIVRHNIAQQALDQP